MHHAPAECTAQRPAGAPVAQLTERRHYLEPAARSSETKRSSQMNSAEAHDYVLFALDAERLAAQLWGQEGSW